MGKKVAKGPKAVAKVAAEVQAEVEVKPDAVAKLGTSQVLPEAEVSTEALEAAPVTIPESPTDTP